MPAPPDTTASKSNVCPYAVDADEAIASFQTDRSQGLRASQVAQLRAQVGANQLAQAAPVPKWKKLAAQFKDLVIWILIVAAIISGAVGEWADTAAILAIVLVNGIIGFLQEEKAERALAALQKLSTPMAKVIRDGNVQSIAASELVPGDRVELEAGDSIPADVRLITAFGFSTQEAALTGESVPAEKNPSAILDVNTALADRRNMSFMGTVAVAGKASAVVVATGMNTELGHIAGLLQSSEPEPTPMQRRLQELGNLLVVICLAIVTIIFVLEYLRGGKLLEVLLISVSLAVAAVPEGLPAVVTLALALGLQRMVKRNALIRKLPSVETLGSVTVVCSDKTGTLTRNEMTVREIVTGNARYHVTGSGYRPHGQFLKQTSDFADSGQRVSSVPDGKVEASRDNRGIDPHQEPDLLQALTIGVRCNNATLSPRGDDDQTWEIIGDPTEGALLVAGRKAGIRGNVHDTHILYEIPFDAERKAMSIVVRGENGCPVMYTKGAPEMILAKCVSQLRNGRVEPLDEASRAEIMRESSELASRALRVLALAVREHAEDPGNYEEKELILVALAGMIDPPRDEVKDAVLTCRAAGIRPIMITGDHPATALAIARELHLAEEGDTVVTGQDLNSLSDEDLAAKVQNISVYARVSPEHKLRVVRAWKRRGEIVAMTGDGVNDAPAVQAADIGIAMGGTGTDVTKESSDMVLMDDNFTSIINAIEEGRGIFDNIQKFVLYLLSCNASEVLLMFFAALIGWPVPLMAIQILWINLVTDGLPALALAMEPPERDIMRRAPRPPREPVINLQRGLGIVAHGILLSAAAILGFWITYQGDATHLARARGVAFCTISFAQLFYSFACRSQRDTMPVVGFFSNPYLLGAIAVSGLLQLSAVTLPFAQPVFGISSHFGWEWLLILFLSLAPVSIIEIVKLLRGAQRQLANGRE